MAIIKKSTRGRKKTRDVGRKVLAVQRNEPLIADVETGVMSIQHALQHYYQQELPDSTKLDWLTEYMTVNSYSKEQLKKIRKVDGKNFTHPDINLIRLINRGYHASEKHQMRIKSFVDNLLEIKEESNEITVSAPKKLSPLAIFKKHQAEKAEIAACDFAGYLDQELDKIVMKQPVSSIDFDAYIRSQVATKKTLQRSQQLIAARIEEFESVKLKGDEYKKEAYSCFKPKDITRILTYFYDVQSVITKYIESLQKESKRTAIRKVRKVDPAKLTKNLKFNKSDSIIEPKDIINSRALLTFNDKYNILTLYRSNDVDGLTIKGSKVLNYSESKTVSKRFKSKVDNKNFIKDLLSRKNMTEVIEYIEKAVALFGKSDIKVNGRINEATNLLKVF